MWSWPTRTRSACAAYSASTNGCTSVSCVAPELKRGWCHIAMTFSRGVRGEIVDQPLHLRRAGAAAAGDAAAVAVEHDDVPVRADVVAVVRRCRGPPACGAEVAEVAVEVAGVPVVVAGRRPRAGLGGAAPARVVAVRELGGRAVRVDVVAERVDAAVDAGDERAGGLVAAAGAVGDVADADDDRIGAGAVLNVRVGAGVVVEPSLTVTYHS